MRPIIAIPSYNRPDAKIFNKLSSIKLQKFVFVRKEQYKDYAYLQEKGFDVVTLPASIEELGMTRRYIVWWCDKHGYDWTFMFHFGRQNWDRQTAVATATLSDSAAEPAALGIRILRLTPAAQASLIPCDSLPITIRASEESGVE